jgi:hypothetical protein
MFIFDNSRQLSPEKAKQQFLNGLKNIASILKVENFSKDEASDWYDNVLAPNNLPTILEIRLQWEKFPPNEYGDPFGIVTFWENQRQAEWDASQVHSPIFQNNDDSFGYSLLMNNIRRGS